MWGTTTFDVAFEPVVVEGLKGRRVEQVCLGVYHCGALVREFDEGLLLIYYYYYYYYYCYGELSKFVWGFIMIIIIIIILLLFCYKGLRRRTTIW